MSLSPHEIAQLRKIVSIAEKILAKATAPKKRAKLATSTTKPRKNPRRKGRELVASEGQCWPRESAAFLLRKSRNDRRRQGSAPAAKELKEVVAEQALELRLLKKA
ncbi:hypothetical protein [Methylocystis sp.]|uniref:hypothetical protein n=1 Tax=Methylocystis sp. TaxID=1911079 RepID=UPI003DA366EF